MFNDGIVCLHVLASLKFNGNADLPDSYILPRWMRYIKIGIKIPIYDNSHNGMNAQIFFELSKMCNVLIDEALLDEETYDTIKL